MRAAPRDGIGAVPWGVAAYRPAYLVGVRGQPSDDSQSRGSRFQRRGGAGRAVLNQGRIVRPRDRSATPYPGTGTRVSRCPSLACCLLLVPAEPRNILKSSLCIHTHTQKETRECFFYFFN